MDYDRYKRLIKRVIVFNGIKRWKTYRFLPFFCILIRCQKTQKMYCFNAIKSFLFQDVAKFSF